MNRRGVVGQASSLSPRASCPRKELGLEAPATGWKPVLLNHKWIQHIVPSGANAVRDCLSDEFLGP